MYVCLLIETAAEANRIFSSSKETRKMYRCTHANITSRSVTIKLLKTYLYVCCNLCQESCIAICVILRYWKSLLDINKTGVG